ncbi:hypothetical protein PG989_011953 [Apiospora arundinis]
MPTGTGSMSASMSVPVSGGTATWTQTMSTGSLPPFMNSSSSSYPATGSIGTGSVSSAIVSVTATVSITSTAVISRSGMPPIGGPSDTSCSSTTLSTSVVVSSTGIPDGFPDTTCTTSSTPTVIHFGNVSSVFPTHGGIGGDTASLPPAGPILTGDASLSSAGAVITGDVPLSSADAVATGGASASAGASSSPAITIIGSSSSVIFAVDPTRTATSYSRGGSSGGFGGSGNSGGASSSGSGDLNGASSTTSSSAPTCTPTQDTVMIDNGGFERGLSPWQVGAFEPLLTDFYITKPDVGSGSAGSCRSLAVDLMNGGDNWGAQWWDFELRSPVVLRLSPSPQRYVLSFSLKFALANQARVAAVLDGVTVATVVAERGADSSLLEGSAASATRWTQWGVVFELGARRNFGVVRFEYYLNGAPENTIWIDGIDIAPYVEPLSSGGGNGTDFASLVTPSSRVPLAETAVLAVKTTKAPGA